MSEGAARSTMGAIMSPINKIGEIGADYVRDNMSSDNVVNKINQRIADQEAAKKTMKEPRETILTSGVE